jgi:hypothetical protein
MALLAALAAGCGSTTSDDRQVLRFIEFNGDNITQADSVNPTSANVDVVPSICEVDEFGFPTTFEVFTETIINAVFVNEEASDILLQTVTVDPGPSSGLGIIQETISTNIPGGECTSTGRPCAVDADCTSSGGFVGICVHTETTVGGILLFDFLAKFAVNPAIYGEAQNVKITFTGTDDRARSFRVVAGYVVTFDNFDNCESPTAGSAGLP